ncbi:hypothetical protein PoB_006990300 [Plakobranchus ocellatus]|uniref:Uncharacterized protein n=1 Tax=Plakobranchus ocellatus TaxID=259542 RepID=A0AAV4DGG0_9GAST|nr:hypothetical protein PoB_006990300 [Plakobranchus ocellatus]
MPINCFLCRILARCATLLSPSHWLHSITALSYLISEKPYGLQVLEVIDDGRQLFISCLRPKASSSKQAGEVWVFLDTPDESLVTPGTDTVTRLSDPVVDPIKGTYTFV